MRLPQETIRAKRDGQPLDPEEIRAFVRGLVDGTVGEGQAAAFAMAVFFRGLALPERVALTRAMAKSGRVLTWDLPGPVLDKHSTGGIGDTVSLPLAALVAACGGYVPMISGRGLGHTGGTLDKLGSIPGYDATPGLDAFRRVVGEVGCAIIGQTADLAPADRRLYAIRDVTGTVESLDLITASILSKKLAAGLDGLVMDVKQGSGAFMVGLPEARALAESIVTVAEGAGLRTAALITDMDAPLASAAGNAVEVAYAIAYLTGARREPRFHAVTVALGAEMLMAGGLAADRADAAERLERSLASGQAAERFARMVAALGGPGDLLERSARYLPESPVRRPVQQAGTVAGVATRALGLAVVELGGGRTRPEDAVDPRVGFTDLAGPGATGGLLGIVHAADEASADRAEAALRAAYRMGEASAERPVVIAAVGPR
ncbi:MULTISPECIES: thymidine phosphorylase [Methylobacterium]|uniref:Thymidine phosphorylase n=1 Tax=Methylobacterium longum TaxID=767694 RepID=A0ABT8AQU6_9HYPH|nr:MULTISPECIES: thymidine phosphorylase [Methylobacterium]MCJ2102149.1 thymidine phosphorylase [Methylobacterium sp. E-046]MDN3571975.1 thymidine phosphorylase [Methylobacterium longum]GJE10955.1 Thymidine phosphorylase [Methylobacterium longum]